jgi:hypothetical protein
MRTSLCYENAQQHYLLLGLKVCWNGFTSCLAREIQATQLLLISRSFMNSATAFRAPAQCP